MVSVVGTFLDIFTKFLAAKLLVVGQQIEILGQLFGFILVFNKAAVWGIDPRHWLPWFPLNGFFMIFSSLAVIILIIYYASIKQKDWFLLWGLSLIMPGALGNFIDRVMFIKRGVVDFIRLGISEQVYWPIFNFADMYITFGVGFILLSIMLEGKVKKDGALQQSPQV
jgi:signal peptidase II